MTRINIIDPALLSDQHLMAEYHEIFMVPASLRRSLRTRSISAIMDSVPMQYTLNKGHVLFFYDKRAYLAERYETLKEHLTGRGFNLDPARADFPLHGIPDGFLKGWTPTEEERHAAECIIFKRLEEKLSMRPEWYRWTQRREA
ncbi:MAG: hypothetical protein A2Y38_19960 [Spirochaetes bacterium GWB1_59_5]|nr:MAG: hypothetical protein A2Y38_19960 [Spirochaetes bacterium GWB1_59_5]